MPQEFTAEGRKQECETEYNDDKSVETPGIESREKMNGLTNFKAKDIQESKQNI